MRNDMIALSRPPIAATDGAGRVNGPERQSAGSREASNIVVFPANAPEDRARAADLERARDAMLAIALQLDQIHSALSEPRLRVRSGDRMSGGGLEPDGRAIDLSAVTSQAVGR